MSDAKQAQEKTGLLALADPQPDILTDIGFKLWWRANYTNEELPVLDG